MNDLLVAVPTRRRPVSLARTLRSLNQCPAPPGLGVEILVVDNDPSGSAASAASIKPHRYPIHYTCEPRVGIPFARNRALEFGADFDLIAFIDDDEVADSRWLLELVSTLETCSAEAATGRVVQILPVAAPSWIIRGGFFEPERYPDGSARPTAYTNNVVMRTRGIDEMGLRFDEAFPFLGGEDTWFFHSLTAAGGRIVWSDRAVVSELIPESRLTASWLMRRSYGGGYGPARRRIAAEPGPRRRLLEASRALWQLLDGVRLAILAVHSGYIGVVRAGMRFSAGAGTAAAIFGRPFEPYREVDGE